MNPDGPMSGRSARIRWVDYARGIAIILIVYGHVARGVHSAGLFSAPGVFSVIDSIVYTFHIPLFFFLSGLFCVDSLNRRGPRAFTVNKCRTIFYPYVVWSLLQGMVEVIFAKYTNGSVTTGEVLSFLWAPRAQFWFLYVLFVMFLLAAVVYGKLSPRYYLSAVMVAAGLYVMKNSLPEILPVRYLAGNMVFFCLGVYFNRIDRFLTKHQAIIFPVTLFAFVLCQTFFHFYLQLTFRAETTWLVLSVSLISVLGVVFCCRMMTILHWSWLAYLGRASLAIYLMHILAAAGTRVLLHQGLGINETGIHLAAGVTAGIIIPLLIRAVLKRSGWLFFYRAVGIRDEE